MENMASYSALGEYGLWKNLKFGEAKLVTGYGKYEAIFSITRHQPGGICTNIFNISWPNAIGDSGHCGQDMSRNAIGYLVGHTDGGRQVET